MKLSPKQILVVAAGLIVVIGAIVLVVVNIRPTTVSLAVKLVVWGSEDRDAFAKITEAYKKFRPNVEVEYIQVDSATYGDTLVNALAAGRGPDVFMIGNRDLPRERDKLVPVDPAQLTLVSFRDSFPTVAEGDFVLGNRIYALPLYIDTLALFYNRDLFDQAGIVEPPKNWEGFQDAVSKLRVVKERGQITRAGAAIGGSGRTIPSAVDLLHLLMLQNGTQMTLPNFSGAAFASFDASGKTGLNAFNFYLQFANIGSPYYTWNDAQENALDSFAGGKTAMIFDYQSALASLKNKNPFLHIGIAQVPQPKNMNTAVSYARYAGLGVSKQSKVSGWGWDFVLFSALNPSGSTVYLGATGRPPALRQLIAKKLDDPDSNVFARQALTARSWYEADLEKIDEIFNTAIRNVLLGKIDSEQALGQAQDQVSQLMRLQN